MKRVAIVQSNYIPWKGYFDLINSVDEFILYDEVQYTRRDWRNRNRIKTPGGVRWLTIPVNVKGRYHQRIDETTISDAAWGRSHFDTLRQAYRATPHFDLFAGELERLYLQPPSERLSDVNRAFLEWVNGVLEISTPLAWSTDYPVDDARARRDDEGDPSELLAALSEAAGADVYVSGPAAHTYLENERFERRGIRVDWHEYGVYPAYDQPHPPFEHAVSVLDLLFCTGRDAPRYMLSFNDAVNLA